MNIKAAAVVLVAIVVVTVALVVLGATASDGDAAAQDDWLSGVIDGLIGDMATIARTEVRADCVDGPVPPVVEFTGDCDLRVTNGNEIRILRIVPLTSLDEIEAPAPDGDVDVTVEDPDVNEELGIAIGKGTITVTLDCGGLGTSECRVRFLD